MPMSREDAIQIVINAASNWANELAEYIIPGVDAQSQQGYQDSLDEIEEARETLYTTALIGPDVPTSG